MHKLESFALSCGSKIHKPYIHKTYYPIVDKKFICVSESFDIESQKYDFFDDVIFHIKPYLDKSEISVLELGNQSPQNLFYAKPYKHLNYSQSNYLLSKSILYFGNNNLYSSVASALNKKIVCPNKISYAGLDSPYWSNPKDCKIIQAESDLVPNFDDKEEPKTINDVKPEVVAKEVLDSLNIQNEIGNIQTEFIGPEYLNRMLDVVPGDYILKNDNLNGTVNLRMDMSDNFNFLLNCESLKSINLITDKDIPLEYLHAISEKISTVSLFIDTKTEFKTIELFQSLGKPLNFLCKDDKNISKIRAKYIDLSIRKYDKMTLKDIGCKQKKNLRFLSKRNIIFNNKTYNSYLSLGLDRNTTNIENEKDFEQDIPFCRIYSENS